MIVITDSMSEICRNYVGNMSEISLSESRFSGSMSDFRCMSESMSDSMSELGWLIVIKWINEICPLKTPLITVDLDLGNRD